MFQWINPKAWTVTTSAVAIYVPVDGLAQNVVIAALVLAVIAVLSVGIWVVGGVALRRFLVDPQRARWFNLLMAALLVLSAIPILASTSLA